MSNSSNWGYANFTGCLVGALLDVVGSGDGGGYVGQASAGQGSAFLDSQGGDHAACQERGLSNVGHLDNAVRRDLTASAAVLGWAVGCVLPGDLAVSRLGGHDVGQGEGLGGDLTALGASEHPCLAIRGLLTVAQEKTQPGRRGEVGPILTPRGCIARGASKEKESQINEHCCQTYCKDPLWPTGQY